MASKTFNTEYTKILSKLAMRGAKNAASRLDSIAKLTIGSHVGANLVPGHIKSAIAKHGSGTVLKKSFYEEYPTDGKKLKYNRVGNLENSFAAETYANGKTGAFARLEFNAKYMPEDYHLDGKKTGKPTPYDKEAVLKYDYEKGWHGQPVFHHKRMTKITPSPAERIRAEFENIEFGIFISDGEMEETYDELIATMQFQFSKAINNSLRW